MLTVLILDDRERREVVHRRRYRERYGGRRLALYYRKPKEVIPRCARSGFALYYTKPNQLIPCSIHVDTCILRAKNTPKPEYHLPAPSSIFINPGPPPQLTAALTPRFPVTRRTDIGPCILIVSHPTRSYQEQPPQRVPDTPPGVSRPPV